MKGKGWRGESRRHSLARKGIGTSKISSSGVGTKQKIQSSFDKLPKKYIELMSKLTQETRNDGIERAFNIGYNEGEMWATEIQSGNDLNVVPIDIEYPYGFITFHTHSIDESSIIRDQMLSGDDIFYALQGSYNYICLGYKGKIRCYQVNMETNEETTDFITAWKSNDLERIQKHTANILWDNSKIISRYKDFEVGGR